jgi:hypothetical protein
MHVPEIESNSISRLNPEAPPDQLQQAGPMTLAMQMQWIARHRNSDWIAMRRVCRG